VDEVSIEYRACAAACDISPFWSWGDERCAAAVMDFLLNKRIGSAKMAGIYGCSSPQNVENDIANKRGMTML
jgi:hypothetical protein